MKRIAGGCVCAVLLLAVGCVTEEMMAPETSVYGMIKGDVITDIRPMDGGSPQYVQNVALDDSLSINTKETRVGIKSKMGDNVTAVVEFDLYGGTVSTSGSPAVTSSPAENKAMLLLRHAYATANLGSGMSIMAGQNWDVFSPLLPGVNNYGWGWNAGNPGFRRPQVRFEYAHESGLSVRLAAADTLTNDANGTPDLQGRLGYAMKNDEGKKMLEVGVSGVHGFTKADAWNDERQAACLDLMLDLGKVYIKGEVMPWGDNMKSYLAGVAQDVRTQAGWVEIGFKCGEKVTVSLGYLEDNPDDNDLPALSATNTANRLSNIAAFLDVRFQLNAKTCLALEAMSWVTMYDEVGTGKDDYDNTRVTTSLVYKF